MPKSKLTRKERYFEERLFDENSGSEIIHSRLAPSEGVLRTRSAIPDERQVDHKGWATIGVEHDGNELYFEVVPPKDSACKEKLAIRRGHADYPHLCEILAAGVTHVRGVMDEE